MRQPFARIYHSKANARVAENLYRKATGDSREGVTAAIFWLKCRAGWKETSVREVTGEVLTTYVVRVPPPAADTAEWLRRYAQRVVEHERLPSFPPDRRMT